MGIVLPLVALLSVPHATSLYLTFVVFVGAYFGYFFSPLHLCQVFTNEYLKVSTGEIYKEYRCLLYTSPRILRKVSWTISWVSSGFLRRERAKA